VYESIYIYRVPLANVEAFTRVQREALAIYCEHGAIDDATFTPVDLAARYGCLGFEEGVGATLDERIFVSVSHFRDRAQHGAVMALVDADPRIERLYDEVTRLLDVARVVGGEFERVA
jgi:uncharacterized protein YbaA (DUF1428 family)